MGTKHTRDDARHNRLLAAMSEPEFLICLQCETPTYQFEWEDGKVTVAMCNTCGADDPSDFVTEAELEEL